MGIKGAWSLISNEPRRFGETISFSSNEPVEATIFLDGPAFLYHVNVNECYDEYPPSPSVRLGLTPVAPAVIYSRTTNFLAALRSVTAQSEMIHVIMDGMAPFEKVETQVDRFKQIAIQCDERATNANKSKHNILHLLAEWAMEEAVRNVKGVQLHRPTFGEAEPYIDHFIQQQNIENVLIMSGDSDFFVYPHCPGFVPFCGLEWKREENEKPMSTIVSLTAIHYLSSKFWKAYIPYNPRIATAIAALAGCDYGNAMLNEARAKIVMSDIAGLRQKQRTAPSNAAALTGVLRYVGVYVKHYPGGWMTALLTSLGMNDALEWLEKVHTIYFPDTVGELATIKKGLKTSLLPEIQRVVDFEIFYCRPLVESCGENRFSRLAVNQMKKVSNRSGKSKRKRRIHKLICEAILFPKESEDNNKPSDTQVQIPLRDAEVEACILVESVWLYPPFTQMRSRMYSWLLRGKSTSAVQEYSRCGKGFGVGYVATTVVVMSMDSAWEKLSGTQALGYMVGIDNISSLNQFIGDIPTQYHVTFVASLLLSPKPALLLIILVTLPENMVDPKQLAMKKSTPSLERMINLVSTAWFHVHLAVNAIGSEHLQPPKILQKLSWGIAAWIFQLLDDEINSQYSTALEIILMQIEKSQQSSYNCSSTPEWKWDTSQLWRQWLICNDLLFK